MGIIKKSGADIILMIETYGCSDNIADCLGYYHRLIADNLSIYSRHPIVKTYTFPGKVSTFNFGGAEIDVNGKHVRVFDTWLHYLPDARLVPTDKPEADILAWDDEGSRDDEIRAIRLVNLDEAVTTMYPLMEPTLESLAAQILESQSTEGITYTDSTKYTSYVLLQAVQAALDKAQSAQ